jgi:hypothetical protein
VTWFITKDGVWRQDPKGTALLRYLPPVLQDNQFWKQKSGADEVWFRLKRQTPCESFTGNTVPECWDLTVLNRQERTTFRLTAGMGVLTVQSENYAKPAESYTKSQRFNPPNPAVPNKADLLKDGARLPDGALPPVTSVTSDEFDAAVKALLGGAVTAVDLDADGKPERIEGKLGEWTNSSFKLYDNTGKEFEHLFLSASDLVSGQNRLEVVAIKGLDRPGLLYSVGNPPQYYWSNLVFVDGGTLHNVVGWHPKMTPLWAAGVSVQPDGLVAATGIPDQMGGYSWTRYYRIAREGADYKATLERQELKAGAYPTEPQAVLAAALVTHWYGKDADLSLYAPDAAVQAAITGAKVDYPAWLPGRAKVGKLVPKQMGQPPQPYPSIEPAPLDADGAADFLIEVSGYEGYTWWSGRVTFGPAKDGRLVIRSIEFQDTGFVY